MKKNKICYRNIMFYFIYIDKFFLEFTTSYKLFFWKANIFFKHISKNSENSVAIHFHYLTIFQIRK